MRKRIEEYKAYFALIAVLLLLNVLFFISVLRETTCDPNIVGSKCIAKCASTSWSLSDHLFYCSCECEESEFSYLA